MPAQSPRRAPFVCAAGALLALAASRAWGYISSMRADLEPVDKFLQLMRDNRPCPHCGSLRVVVRRDPCDQQTSLRSECADCQHQSELGVVVLE